ncbi:MAG: DUF1573 domain-containing protein [Chitinispirillaceae bacterium]|nr:DUF1573 domain-containing protein [Chitinispirillaceae bacterium]
MRLGIRRMAVALCAAAFTPSMLAADPMISVDAENYDVDTIIQGQVQVIKHTFKIRNTGDSVLLIANVRAG